MGNTHEPATQAISKRLSPTATVILKTNFVRPWRGILALPLLLAVAHNSFAGPARMWFSLSGYDPFRFALDQPSAKQPAAAQIEILGGKTGTLYLWGQPQTVTLSAPYSTLNSNTFRQLTSLSLQIDATGSSAAATEAPARSARFPAA